MEYPGEKSEALIVGVFPMTIVTAIVSPRARASARKIEPMMPVRAKGTTTFQVDSQRVEPAQAPLHADRVNGKQHFPRTGNDVRDDHNGQDDSPP